MPITPRKKSSHKRRVTKANTPHVCKRHIKSPKIYCHMDGKRNVCEIVLGEPGCGKLYATKAYPDTSFLRSAWSIMYSPIEPRVLAFVDSVYRPTSKNINIYSIYSKWEEKKLWMKVSPAERKVLSGMGKSLLLACLRPLPLDTKITLDVSGGFPWSARRCRRMARGMSREEIIACLPISEEVPLTDEDSWVKMAALLMTDELAMYYRKHFGFVKRGYDGAWSVRMSGSVRDVFSMTRS